jgi:monoterpene epsilon-lactone hydrolase
MPSLRSRLLLFVMKNRHLLRFLFKKENIDWNATESILHFPEQCEEGARRFGKIPSGIEINPVDIDGLSAEWIMPSQATKNKVIFFVHGGQRLPWKIFALS